MLNAFMLTLFWFQEEAASSRRKDGVTFSDSVMEPERKASIPSVQRSAQPLPGPPARAAGAPKPAGQKTSAGGKPPGVMKKTDSTVGAKVGAKKSDSGAKGSPAQARKVSQAVGAKKPGDAGVKVSRMTDTVKFVRYSPCQK